MTNGTIGFGYGGKQQSNIPMNSNSKDIESGEIDVLRDVKKRISEATISFQKFENSLQKELWTVDDLRKNLGLIKEQIRFLEDSMRTREGIVEKLMIEHNKHRNMNIEQCKRFFGNIKDIDQTIRANIEKINNELNRLILDEKSLLDTESGNKEIISDISQEAQQLSNKVIIMARHHTSLNDVLEQIYNEVLMIEKERGSRRFTVKGFA